jgi:hypothetical protein
VYGTRSVALRESRYSVGTANASVFFASFLVIAMTLTELLIAICFFTPLGSAYGSASRMKVGFGGHVLAVVIGLAIGVGFAWTMWLSVPKVAKWIDSLSKPLQKICTVGFLILMLMWICPLDSSGKYCRMRFSGSFSDVT